MRPRFLAVVLCLLLVPTLIVGGHVTEGEGPSVSQLIDEMGADDPDTREAAIRALEEIGPTSIQALIEALVHPNRFIRRGAARVLGSFRSDSRPAIPHLLATLEDDDSSVRRWAANALGQIGDPAAVPRLLAACEDPDAWVREEALRALGRLQPSPELQAVVGAAVHALTDPVESVRAAAAAALARMGKLAREALPSVIGVLVTGPSPRVRVQLIAALGSIADATDVEVVQTLLRALEDPDSRVQGAAVNSLIRIRATSEDVVQALAGRLSSQKWGRRFQAAQALGGIGPAAGVAVPALVQALEDEQPWVRVEAARALARIGRAAQDAVPILIRALDGDEVGEAYLEFDSKDVERLAPDPGASFLVFHMPMSLRAAAAEALARAGAGVPGTVPAFVRTVLDENSTVRATAERALRELSPVAEDAHALAALLGQGSPEVRRAAVGELVTLGGVAAPVAPDLAGALHDVDPEVRALARNALALVGPAALAPVSAALAEPNLPDREAVVALAQAIGDEISWVVNALTQALTDPDSWVRGAAAHSLGRIGPIAAPSVPALAKLVREDDAWWWNHTPARRAVWALGEIGVATDEAIAVLAEAVGSGDRDLQVEAIAALGKLGPQAAEAAPALVPHIGHSDRERAESSAAALLQMGLTAIPHLEQGLVRAVTTRQWSQAAGIEEALEILGASPFAVLFEFMVGQPRDAHDLLFDLSFRVLSLARPKDLPFILAQMESQDPERRQLAISALSQLAWWVSQPEAEPEEREASGLILDRLLRALSDSDTRVRTVAISGLGKLAVHPEAVVSALIEVLTTDVDWEIRFSVTRALRQMGEWARPAVPYLVPLAQRGWIDAIKTLGAMGPAAADAVPTLLAILSSRLYHPVARAAAASALAQIGVLADDVGMGLLAALNDPSPPARGAAASALGTLGIRGAIPALLRILAEDPDIWVRAKASAALGDLQAQEAVPFLVEILLTVKGPECLGCGWFSWAILLPDRTLPVEPWEKVQMDAATALGRLGDPRALPALVRALDHPHVWVAHHAALALAQFGPEAKDAVPGLVRLHATAMATQMRLGSATAVEAIGPAALPRLIEIIRGADPRLRGAAELLLFSALHPHGVSAETVPVLLDLFELPYRSAWIPGSTLALGGAEVVPALMDGLDHPNPWARAACVEALAMLGPLASPAVARLVFLLGSSRDGFPVRTAAVEALCAIGVFSEDVLTSLAMALRETPRAFDLRRAAAACLERIGALSFIAADVVPALLEALEQSTSIHERTAAIQSLGTFGALAQSAGPGVLRALREDRSRFVREAAAWNLPQLALDEEVITSALVAALADPANEVAESAERSLEKMPSVSLSYLVAALASEQASASVQVRVAQLLGRRGETDAVPVLLHVLGNPKSAARGAAAVALGELRAVEAVSLLTLALSDKTNNALRAAAAEALGKIGPPAAQAVALLAQALQDQDALVRRAAAAALGEILPRREIEKR